MRDELTVAEWLALEVIGGIVVGCAPILLEEYLDGRKKSAPKKAARRRKRAKPNATFAEYVAERKK